MQKTLFALLAIAFFACKSEEKKPEETKAAAETSTTPPLYTAVYSSKFEMGDSKNSEAILKLWKAWDDGDLNVGKDLFADTVEFYLRDGSTINGPRDSTLANAQAFRNTLASVKSVVYTIFPVKSTDQNENWVCIWGKETSVDKKGKADSTDLQETWRFNKNGKVNLVYQFGKVIAPPGGSK